MFDHRTRLIVVFAALGVALVVAGWVLEGGDYTPGLLLEIGATLLLAGPLIWLQVTVADTRRQIDALRQGAGGIGGSYERLRRVLPSGPQRTAAMEALVAGPRDAALSLDVDRDDVEELFRTGSEGERIYALGLVQGDPRLASEAMLQHAIVSSKSAFEQYHGLMALERALPSLPVDARSRLLAVVRRQASRDARLTGDSDRAAVVSRLEASSTSS